MREECIFFESTIKPNKSKAEITVFSSTGNAWNVTEHWLSDDFDLIQEIDLQRENEDLKTYCYASLEVDQIYPKYIPSSEFSIKKWTRTLSFSVHFEIYLNEYRHSKDGFDLHDLAGPYYPIPCGSSNFYKVRSYRKDFAIMGDSSSSFNTNPKVYRLKIELSSILPLVDAPAYPRCKSQKRKTTKGRFMDGLKELSSNIGSLLVDHLSDTFGEDPFSDVILHCGRHKMETHRNVLCARCPRFSDIFHRITKCKILQHTSQNEPTVLRPRDCSRNTAMPIVSISDLESWLEVSCDEPRFILNPRPVAEERIQLVLDDIDESVFIAFLKFIYDGRLSATDIQPVLKLFHAARRYGMEDLKTKCLLSIKSLFTETAVFDVLELACSIRNDELIHSSLMTIKSRDNLDDFIAEHQHEWDQLCEKYSFLSRAMFDDDSNYSRDTDYSDNTVIENVLEGWFGSDNYARQVEQDDEGHIGYFVVPGSEPWDMQ